MAKMSLEMSKNVEYGKTSQQIYNIFDAAAAVAAAFAINMQSVLKHAHTHTHIRLVNMAPQQY